MLFSLLTGPTFADAHAALGKALAQGVDGVEIRVDTFEKIDLAEMKRLKEEAASVKVLFTLRSEAQGGSFCGEEGRRLQLLDKLCALGADFIDLEYDICPDFRKACFEKYPRVKFFSSYHNFEETPADLFALLTSIRTPYAHIYKIATMGRSALDALRMLHFVRSHAATHFLIGIVMGEHGLPTRILGPVVGNFLDYTFMDPREQTAPGQLAIDELLSTYRYRSLNKRTEMFFLIGSPVSRSLGALIHNAVFDALHINAVYLKIELHVTELVPFFVACRRLCVRGMSVTMPLKEAVLPLLDDLTSAARAIGAVNTITLREEKWVGDNTDGVGALEAIEEKISVKGKKMVVMGAGGAAKALVYEAMKRGATVYVLNRTAAKAQELAEKFHCGAGGFDLFPEMIQQGYDILVNCIPDSFPLHPGWILAGCYAMDMVYNPKFTPFMLLAQERGCQLIFGEEMFINQAVEQQLIWFGLTLKKGLIKEIITIKLA